jgi:Ca2+-binding EF-hand superfamily protein
MRPLFTIILNLSLAGFLTAAAEKPSPQARENHQLALFADFDKNHNGKLTEKEFIDTITHNLFNEFDLNKDGKVSKSEYHSHAKDKAHAKKEYPLLDQENKGYITMKDVYRHKDLISELKLAFTKLDTKSKGFVTIKDLPDVTPNN